MKFLKVSNIKLSIDEKEQKALNGDADAAEEAAIDIEPKDEITFDDFEKVQFRVAKVLTCEAVKKTKLLKFELQIGDEKRLSLIHI